MQIHNTAIAGVQIIELDLHGDARGFFVERYHQGKLATLGFHEQFVQDNHSRSAPGVLRGIHYQHAPAQAKLVGVTRGCIWDVAVDLRPESPTFGAHVALELSDVNGTLLFIPEGCGHGFCVLGDEPADVLYKVTSLYNAAGEGGVMYNDPALAIDWPVEAPVLSPRDQGLESFVAYSARMKG